MRLFLASQSPRRRQLLEQIGQSFEVLTLDLPEVRAPDESPDDYVRQLSSTTGLPHVLVRMRLGGASGTDVQWVDDEPDGEKVYEAEPEIGLSTLLEVWLFSPFIREDLL